MARLAGRLELLCRRSRLVLSPPEHAGYPTVPVNHPDGVPQNVILELQLRSAIEGSK